MILTLSSSTDTFAKSLKEAANLAAANDFLASITMNTGVAAPVSFIRALREAARVSTSDDFISYLKKAASFAASINGSSSETVDVPPSGGNNQKNDVGAGVDRTRLYEANDKGIEKALDIITVLMGDIKERDAKIEKLEAENRAQAKEVNEQRGRIMELCFIINSSQDE